MNTFAAWLSSSMRGWASTDSRWAQKGILCGWLFIGSLASLQAAEIGPIGDAHFDSIDGSESIGDGVVTALAQGSDGFLWIGTAEGLIRFDGYRMLHFRHDPDDSESLGADFVRDLLPIDDGGLWVATGTGGLSRFNPVSGRFQRFRHDANDPTSIGHNGVLALAPADNGGQSVWLALAGAGLDRFDPATDSFVHHRSVPGAPDSISHDTVRSVLRDRRGNLWIGTRRGLSRRFPDGRWETIAAGIHALQDQYIYSLFESSDGRIWVGTQGQGAGWIDPKVEGWHPLPLGAEVSGLAHPGLAHPWVTDFAEPQPGQLWVATYGSGIDVLDGKREKVERRIRRDPALPGSLALDSVTSLFSDASGLLWVGSWGGGLQRHNPGNSAFHALHYSPSRPHGLSDASVLSVAGRADATIWIGNESQGIDVLDRQRGVIDGFRHDPAVAGSIPPGAISALIEHADGTVWVATRQAGLHHFDAKERRFVAAPGATGSAATRISRIFPSHNGQLLLVVESGLLQFDPATGRSEPMRLDDGGRFELPVLTLAEEADGRLWVGTANGLLQRRPGGQGLLPTQPQVPGGKKTLGAIQALIVDADDTLWLASADQLWFATAPRSEAPLLQRLELGLALPKKVRWSELVADRKGRFWAGNVMIDPQERRAWPIGRAEGADIGGRTEGMSGRTDDGLLLFGGTRGLLIVDPQAFSPWTFEPSMAYTEVSVDGLATPWLRPDTALQLPPTAHRFSVEFAALDLSAPQLNRYRYRLLGVDDDWILTDADHRVATYSTLWPGRYELQLSGSNRLGQWSTRPLSLVVEVQPAFWQTVWFLLLMLLLLGSLIYLGILARTARIRSRSRELSLLVEQRSNELSTAHRTLLDTQEKLAVQERVAALGGLVAGVAHEVSTPLGVVMTALSGIADAWKQVSARVRSGSRTEELEPLLADGEEYTELAMRNSDRVGDLVANLKAIVARRDSDFVAVVDLSLHLREASALVSAELRLRGCRIDVLVDEGLTIATVPDALTEVLARVLRNTVDHAFADRSDGLVVVSAQKAGDAGVEIVIRDNGRGITPEALGQVFDPFFTTRRGRDGFVGLGLYVAYAQATQRLKGSIKISSTIEQGTEVRLWLPDLSRSAAAITE